MNCARVAALYDIHGNLPALEAVVRELVTIPVDKVVVGGDVLPGPMPLETLATLGALQKPVTYILGNGEDAVLKQMAGSDLGAIPEQGRTAIAWTASQLNATHERLLRAWEKTARIEVQGLGKVLFCHATPRSDTEIFTRATPEEQAASMFAGVSANLVVCGHTHMQFERTVSGVRVVNAGSVGMPFGKPGAFWLLLGPDVNLRRTSYDLEAAAARVRATEYPQADDFASSNILHPPSEEEILVRWSG